MSQSNIGRDRFPLSNNDLTNINRIKLTNHFFKPIYKEVASTVEFQGWISLKQRKVLEDGIKILDKHLSYISGKVNRSYQKSAGIRSSGIRHQVDYDESDWEITDYELCAGAWGD